MDDTQVDEYLERRMEEKGFNVHSATVFTLADGYGVEFKFRSGRGEPHKLYSAIGGAMYEEKEIVELLEREITKKIQEVSNTRFEWLEHSIVIDESRSLNVHCRRCADSFDGTQMLSDGARVGWSQEVSTPIHNSVEERLARLSDDEHVLLDMYLLGAATAGDCPHHVFDRKI